MKELYSEGTSTETACPDLYSEDVCEDSADEVVIYGLSLADYVESYDVCPVAEVLFPVNLYIGCLFL